MPGKHCVSVLVLLLLFFIRATCNGTFNEPFPVTLELVSQGTKVSTQRHSVSHTVKAAQHSSTQNLSLEGWAEEPALSF